MMSRFATPACVGVAFALFFLLEKAVPLRRQTRELFGRLFVNLLVSASAFAVAAVFVHPLAKATLGLAAEKPFGLLRWIPLPPAAEFVCGFLLMDLAFYHWHVLNHRVPLLWRFHNVHHCDPDLDVSTGFRFHFGEVAMSALFRVAQVAVIGLSGWTFAVYEIVFQLNTLFHHSNVRLPIRLERLLNQILVTPRMHGIHHSQIRRETDSNYGVVFPWWDRVHRTLGLHIPQHAIVIGVPGYAQPDDNRLGNLFAMPFRKQRDYWRAPDGTVPARDASASQKAAGEMAE